MKHFLWLLCLVSSFTALSQNNVFNNQEQKLVVDNANVFTSAQVAALTQKLNSFDAQSSVQILVYTTTDLQGYTAADFAQQIGQGWGVGTKKYDNGIVVLYKPKTSESRGEVAIQVGYGIEAHIPDIEANRIIQKVMIPMFKAGDVYGGIDKGVDACIALVNGEYHKEAQPYEAIGFGVLLLMFICFMGVVAFVVLISKTAGTHYTTHGKTSTNNTSAINTMLTIATIMSIFGNHRNHHDHFGGGFGGGGGNGFGGFGGGSFGGGGASGSW